MSYQNYLIPELFQDSYLFKLEESTKLPLRLILFGLACCADRAGRFRWKPSELKQQALPYDDIRFEAAMEVLVEKGFLLRYVYQGVYYGAMAVPPKKKNQRPLFSLHR